MTGPRTLLPIDLDLYDLAYLAGGPARVADTAVVVLLERGLLRVDPAGRLAAVGRVAGRPVEAAVLDTLGARPLRSAATLTWRLAEDPRVIAVGDRLVRDGLLRRNPLARLWAGSPRLVRTGAGRRALEQADPARAVGSTDGLAVALHGPAAMGDRVLRDSVSGTDSPRAIPRARGSRRRHGDDSAPLAPYTAWGFAGGDGGSWGGGDGGGGCGGGDGGGC